MKYVLQIHLSEYDAHITNREEKLRAPRPSNSLSAK